MRGVLVRQRHSPRMRGNARTRVPFRTLARDIVTVCRKKTCVNCLRFFYQRSPLVSYTSSFDPDDVKG